MTLPDSVVFWLFVPGLFLVLFFGWLILISRGKRETTFKVSGLGLTLSFTPTDSARADRVVEGRKH